MTAVRTSCLAVALVFAASPSASLQQHRHNSQEALAALFHALDLHEGSVVADVGAGAGDYSIPLAKAVGAKGRVVAVDIEPRVLSRLRERAHKEGLGNIDAVQGDVDNPHLPPASIDGVLIVNAYHEMTSYAAMLKHIRAALKPAGRLVIADFTSPRRSQPREVQTARHEIAPELVLAELRTAGFRILTLEDPFMAVGPQDANHVEWLMVATPAEAPAGVAAIAAVGTRLSGR